MSERLSHFRRKPSGFSLVELLAAMAIFSIVVLIFAQMTDQLTRVWRSTQGRVSQFQQARDAFERILGGLSKATLNPYLDYYDSDGTRRSEDNAQSFVPTRYGRYSELRFRSGKAAGILNLDASTVPTHALFFFAPMGVLRSPEGDSLPQLINLMGYFIHYGADASQPSFIRSEPVFGFRLMELKQRSEHLVLPQPFLPWPNNPLADPDCRVIARNVIAMVVLPKMAKGGPLASGVTAANQRMLAPRYEFDSFTRGAGETTPSLNTLHQLPPLVSVTLVVLDDVSAQRLGNNPTPPDLGLNDLFLEASPASYQQDLSTLMNRLESKNLHAQVFSEDVAIKAAHWSLQ